MTVLSRSFSGAIFGATIGVGVSVYSYAHLEPQFDIYWPGLIANDLALYVLPLAATGALFGAIGGWLFG